jgi:argininosuccinate lyase
MKTAAQQGYTTATDLADYLTAKGIPFRSAHEIVGRIVAYGIREKKALHDMKLKELQSFSPAIAADALACLKAEHSVSRRSARGGTAPHTVKKAINKAWHDLKKQRKTRAAAKPVLQNK